MAVSQETLSVEVVLDSKGAIKGIKDLSGNFISMSKITDSSSKSISSFENAVSDLSKEAQKTGSVFQRSFDKIKKSLNSAFIPLTTLNQGFQLLSGVIGKLQGAFSGSINLFAQMEQSQIRLEKALKLNSERINATTEQWLAYTNAIEKSTGADADMLNQLVATSIQTGLSEKQVKNLIDASVRLAEVTGKDLSSAYQIVMNSFKGQARELALYVPELRNLTSEQLQAGAAADLINEKFKNVESTFSRTAAGSMKSLSIAFDDLQKAIGQAIFQFFNMGEASKTLVDFLGRITAAINAIDFQRLGQQFQSFISNIAKATPFVAAFALAFTSVRNAILAALIPLTAVAAKFLGMVGGITILIATIDFLARNFERLNIVTDFVFKSITMGVQKMSIAVISAFEKIARAMGLEGVADKAEASLRKLRASILGTQNQLQKAAEKLDFGIVKTVLDEAKKAINAFRGTADDAKKALDNLNASSGVGDTSLLNSTYLNKITNNTNQVAQAFSELLQLIESLKMRLSDLTIENYAIKFNLSDAEKLTLLTQAQIEILRQKAIAQGMNRRLVDAEVARALQLNQEIQFQNELLESQKAIKREMENAQKEAERALAALREKRLAENEELLRYGMHEIDILTRQLEIEMQKIQAVERQLKNAGLLNEFAKEELELARKTVREKIKVAEMEFNKKSSGFIETDAINAMGQSGVIEAIVGTAVAGFMTAAQIIVGAVQALIDFLPNLINSIADIINSLTDFPKVINEALQNLFDSITRFIEEAIPNIISGLEKRIEMIIRFLFEQIPAAIQKLFEAIPNVIVSLIDRIPEFIEKTVSGLIAQSSYIVAAMMKFAIEGMPRIALALVKAIIKLIPAVIRGIIDGMKKIFNNFRDVFSRVTNRFTDTLKKIFDTTKRSETGVASQQFALTEMTDSRPEDEKDNWIAQIINAGKRSRSWLMEAFEFLREIWRWVWDNILKPFIGMIVAPFQLAATLITKAFEGVHAISTFFATVVRTIFFSALDGFQAVFEFARDGVFKPFITLLEGVWNVVNEGILKPFISILKSTWEFIKQGILDPFINVLKGVWEFAKSIFDVVIDSFKALWNFVSTIFTDPIQAFKNLWEDLKNIFSGIFDAFAKLGEVIWNSFVQAASAAWDFVKSVGAAIWDGLKNALSAGLEAFKKAGEQIWNAFKNLWDSFVNIFVNAGKAIWEGFKELWNSFVKIFSDAGKAIFNAFRELWDGAATIFGAAGKLIFGAFKLLWDGAATIFGAAGKWIWDATKTAFGAVGTLFANTGTAIWNSTKTAFGSVGSLFSNVGTSIWDGTKKAFGSVGTLFSNVGTSMWDSFRKGFSGLGNFFKTSLDAINPANLLQKLFKIDFKGMGTVERFLGIDFPWVNFASGGYVGGQSKTPNNSLLNDTIPAMLSAGEVVIDKETLKDPMNKAMIDTILSGKKVRGFSGGFWGGVKSVGSSIVSGVQSVGSSVVEGFKQVGNFLMPDWLTGIYDSLKRFVSNIDIGALIDNPRRYIENLLKNAPFINDAIRQILVKPQSATSVTTPASAEAFMKQIQSILPRFQNGGLVGGFGGIDNQTARLSSGEFVMQRSAVSANGIAAMNALNEGKTKIGGSTSITINFTLNSTEKIDESLVRNRILPTIKEELRKESLRGGFVIAAQGIR